MKKLKVLKTGDTIGLICPSSAEDPEKIKYGIELIKSFGFNIKEGNHIYDRKGYLAGEDRHRAEDLMNMFKDPEVDMVLCIRGGYGAMRILPYLDFSVIADNPKIFMGFSDVTVLLNNIYKQCNFPTFHGPMGTSNLKDEHTFRSFMDSIKCIKEDKHIIKNPVDIKSFPLIKGKAIGNLVGGNLCLICSTLGTPYEIDFENNILFIEDIGESPYKIDRMLTQLLLSGKIQKCSGVILGGFTDCELKNHTNSLTLDEVFTDRLLNLNIPILSNFSSGHCYPKLTIPIGTKISLDSEKGEIEVLENILVG